MIYTILASVMMAIGIALIFDLTPERVTVDLFSIMTPKDSLREEVRVLRENKKKHGIYYKLVRIKTALTDTGKGRQFTVVCFASVIMFLAGALICVLLDNLFLMPALSVSMALIPFLYIAHAISYYERQTKEELETALSIITTSYIRSEDIISAVGENLKYIKPPLKEVFKGFEGDATAVSANIKRALHNLKGKIDDEVFAEWCDTLIRCQDDRTLKDTLQAVVAKLTDVRIVNNELKTMLASARNEYYMMVAMVLGNIPLLYFLNREWYETLMYTTPGKLVLGVCGAVILITALFMMRFTKPIEYKR